MKTKTKKTATTKSQKNLEVQYIDPNLLIPYVNNTKIHTEEQIELLMAVIAEFGFDVPIVVDSEMLIIKGHARREAAIRMGMTEVPFIIRDDLTPEQVTAARIADNKLSESEWNYETLKLEFIELQSLGMDMKLTGFDSSIIDALLSSVDGFSFQSDDMYATVDNKEDEEKEEFKESDELKKYNSDYIVVVNFKTVERAESFCQSLQLEDWGFKKKAESKIVYGDKLVFEDIFQNVYE